MTQVTSGDIKVHLSYSSVNNMCKYHSGSYQVKSDVTQSLGYSCCYVIDCYVALLDVNYLLHISELFQQYWYWITGTSTGIYFEGQI